MKYLLSAAAASALMAGTAFAGNIETAPAEPVIAPAPMPVYASPDWTGFYAGAEMGYADIDTSGPNGDGFIGGLVAGYDYDLGDWVIGAGLDYDWADISMNPTPVKIESLWRAKLRGGYKIGDGLLYATAGYAQIDTNGFGSEDGWFGGAGYEHLITEQVSLGGEVLYHDFDVSGAHFEATTAQVRATFRF